jgi:hypothetical protein
MTVSEYLDARNLELSDNGIYAIYQHVRTRMNERYNRDITIWQWERLSYECATRKNVKKVGKKNTTNFFAREW